MVGFWKFLSCLLDFLLIAGDAAFYLLDIFCRRQVLRVKCLLTVVFRRLSACRESRAETLGRYVRR